MNQSETLLPPGVYPAAVTPFDSNGKPDHIVMARLLAKFEADGCRGAVLSATNGEGPSLSLVEKRDLIKASVPVRGNLQLMLGIATSSLDEAKWLAKQAYQIDAAAVLVMPPSYYKEAGDEGVERWYSELMDSIEIPLLYYNYPKRTGVTLEPEMLRRLCQHERFVGVKDSSGEEDNLKAYKQAVEGQDIRLFVGNEMMLLKALDVGWSGTISGPANVVGAQLSAVFDDYVNGQKESAETKLELLMPALEALRAVPQPAANKTLLVKMGVLTSNAVRTPLSSVHEDELDASLVQLAITGSMA